MGFKDLLSIYKEKVEQQQTDFLKISQIIKQVVDLDVKESEIKTKEQTVLIKVKPAKKLLILLNKEKIVNSFKDNNLKFTDLK